jgi:protein phosphatase 1 regulatory subunit 7
MVLTGIPTAGNRIVKIEGLDTLTELEELYLSHNGIETIEGLSHNVHTLSSTLLDGTNTPVQTKLTTLDIGNNKIVTVSITSLLPLPLLEEFWVRPTSTSPLPRLTLPQSQANDNQITSLPILPPSSHPALETIYLEGNPIQKEMGTSYNRRIMLEMPQVSPNSQIWRIELMRVVG